MENGKMDHPLYVAYLERLEKGDRTGATDSLRQFISSFSSLSEQDTWCRRFLATYDGRTNIRFELYQDLIFPYILRLREKDPVEGGLALVTTYGSFVRNKKLLDENSFGGEIGLLTELNEVAPNHPRITDMLLDLMMRNLEYCFHEQPHVLYGHDGAGLAECDEIEADIRQAKELHSDQETAVKLETYLAQLQQYREKLSAKG